MSGECSLQLFSAVLLSISLPMQLLNSLLSMIVGFAPEHTAADTTTTLFLAM